MNGWIRMAEWTTCESHPRCTSKYTKHQGFLETLVNSHSLLVKVAIEVVLPIKHADCPSFFQVCLQEVMFWRRISDQWSMVIPGHPVFHAKKRGVDSNHLWLVVLYNHLEEWWTSSMGRINDIPQKWNGNSKIPWFETTNQTLNMGLEWEIIKKYVHVWLNINPLTIRKSVPAAPIPRLRNGSPVFFSFSWSPSVK